MSVFCSANKDRRRKQNCSDPAAVLAVYRADGGRFLSEQAAFHRLALEGAFFAAALALPTEPYDQFIVSRLPTTLLVIIKAFGKVKHKTGIRKFF